jgi:hypothetical protein
MLICVVNTSANLLITNVLSNFLLTLKLTTYFSDFLIDWLYPTSGNIEQFVNLQVEAVDSLGTQMDLFKTKIALYKKQHGSQKLHDYRDALRTSRHDMMHACVDTNALTHTLMCIPSDIVLY